jgi:diacylglycerol kinase (CTP)
MVAGTITAYIFWGTAIASSADHPDGLSWNPHTAVLGATAPGPAQSGWSGWRWGFRGKLPIEYYTSQSSTADAVRNAAAHISTKLTGGTQVTETRAPGMPLPLLCLGSGIVAAVSEGLELGGVDDNLSLPILSGLGIWAWLFLWGRAATWWAQNVA